MKFIKRKIAITVSTCMLITATVNVAAATVTLTTFTSGTNATASEVNGNFTSLKTAVDANTTAVSSASTAATSATTASTTNATNIGTNTTAISNNTTAVASNKTKADGLDNRFTTVLIEEYMVPSTITSKTFKDTSATGTVTTPVVSISHTVATSSVGRKYSTTDSSGAETRNYEFTTGGDLHLVSKSYSNGTATKTFSHGIFNNNLLVYPAKVYAGLAIGEGAKVIQSGAIIGAATNFRVINKIKIAYSNNGLSYTDCIFSGQYKNQKPIGRMHCKGVGLVYKLDGATGTTRELTSSQ